MNAERPLMIFRLNFLNSVISLRRLDFDISFRFPGKWINGNFEQSEIYFWSPNSIVIHGRIKRKRGHDQTRGEDRYHTGTPKIQNNNRSWGKKKTIAQHCYKNEWIISDDIDINCLYNRVLSWLTNTRRNFKELVSLSSISFIRGHLWE